MPPRRVHVAPFAPVAVHTELAMLTVEELRRIALSSAAAPDPQVAEALRIGDMWIQHAVVTWESSEGTTLGHLVGIGLDAALFAHIAPEPPVVDAVTIAIAETIAMRPRESLHELRIHWNGAVRSAGIYRGDSMHIGIAEALESYLMERGEIDATRLARSAKMDIAARGRDITATIDFSADARSDALHFDRNFRIIAEALGFLLAGAEGAHVRVIRAGFRL